MNKPIPEITSLTKPYWDFIQEKKLCIQQCNNCREYIFSQNPGAHYV